MTIYTKYLGLVLFFLLLLNFRAFSQVTSRLTVVSGNSVYFTFNSFTKFTTGIEYTDWTLFDVYFDDPGDVSNRWRLTVNTSATQIDGDGGNTLPLSSIYILGISASATSNGWMSLDTNPLLGTLLTDGLQGAAMNASVSYRCGMAPATSVLGEATDFYFVDLIFTLEPR